MATTAKSTRTTANTKPKTATAPKSDSAQVKARNGALTVAERAVDVPVGAALTIRDRVEDAIEPWTSETTREKELKSLRTQVTRELNKFERRGGQARRKASQRVRSTRTKVEREVKSRRREVEKAVKENRAQVEQQLKKARTVVEERVPAISS
jgi:hypothetical protein